MVTVKVETVFSVRYALRPTKPVERVCAKQQNTTDGSTAVDEINTSFDLGVKKRPIKEFARNCVNVVVTCILAGMRVKIAKVHTCTGTEALYRPYGP